MPVVDLRFVVHDKADIDLATKSLVAFNKVSLKRQKNYDAEAAAAKRGMAATTKLTSLERKLNTQRKIETQLVEEGLMTRREQAEASKRYDRILQQETRTLQDYIDTDRVLQREQKEAAKSEESLGKQRTKTKNETEKLRMTYDSTYAATKRYKQGLLDIDRAFEGMEDGPERASRAIEALKSDYQAFIAAAKSGQLVDAGNQFARYGDQAYRAQQRVKRFASVGLQQAGYQVNDFIVQIASGQNALVAFGQQGSQLAGIFGTKGAVIGALIAGASAIGNIIYQTWAAKEGVKSLEDAFSDLSSATGDYKDAAAAVDMEDLREQFGGFADSVLATRDAYIELEQAAANFEATATLKALLKGQQASFLGTLLPEDYFSPPEDDAYNMYTMKNPAIAALMSPVTAMNEGMTREQTRRTITHGASQLFPDQEVNQAYSAVKELQEDMQNATVFGRYEDYKAVVDSINEVVALQDELGVKRIDLNVSQRDYIDGLLTVKKELEQQLGLMDGSVQKVKEAVKAEEVRQEAVDEWVDSYVEWEKGEERRAKEAERLQKLEDKLNKARFKVIMDQIDAANKKAEAEQKALEASELQLQKQQIAIGLQQTEVKYGQESLEYREAQVKAAQDLARLTAEQKFQLDGITDAEQDQIDLLVEAAGEAEVVKQNLIDSRAEAAGLATNLRSAVSALNSLMGLGDNIDKAIAVAQVRLGELQLTGDTQMAQIAATIEGQRQDLKKFYEKAFEGLDKGDPQFSKLIDERFEANQKLYDLQAYLELIEEENDRIRESNKSDRKGSKGKKKPGLIMTEELFAMNHKIELQKVSLGKSKEEVLFEKNKSQLLSKITAQMVGMSEVDKAFYIQQAEGAARFITNKELEMLALLEIKQTQEALAESIADSMGDAFMSMVDGTKSVKDAFKDMARAIIKELYQVLVVQRLVGSAKEGSRSGIAGAIANSIPSFFADGEAFSRGNVIPNANGNAMYGGNVIPFADGGAMYGGNVIPFANGGVIGGPTTFPMSAGRTGLMGEDGPEAIMPLKRGANGKLGVQAEGGSSNVVIHQSFNFAANGDESVKKLIAQAAPQIASLTKSSMISDRRRGGQMKATFG